MPPFVLADLAVNLSPSAALWIAIDPDAIWDLQSMLLAQQIDQFATFVWALGGQKGPRPEPIPRPGAQPDVQVIGGLQQSLPPGVSPRLAVQFSFSVLKGQK